MRRPLPIRLLALDLDGTVLGADLTVRPRVIAAVAEAQERGTTVVIATGRMFRSAWPVARILGLSTPLVCNHGAYVREQASEGTEPGATLYHLAMRAWVAREVISWTRERGFDPHLNTPDRLVLEEGDEGAPDYERALSVEAYMVPDLLKAARRRPTKVLAVGPEGLAERHLADARERFGAVAQATVSHPAYLEFTAPGVHKGRALKWLGRRFGIPMREAMAIGDQLNDVEMLGTVAHGVAMGGAPEPVRAAARYATSPWDEDGAALAIEALILGRGSLD